MVHLARRARRVQRHVDGRAVQHHVQLAAGQRTGVHFNRQAHAGLAGECQVRAHLDQIAGAHRPQKVCVAEKGRHAVAVRPRRGAGKARFVHPAKNGAAGNARASVGRVVGCQKAQGDGVHGRAWIGEVESALFPRASLYENYQIHS